MVVSQPARASRQAMPSPMTPAPTTIVFGRVVETPKVALITDSLHRACPARFCGSDLSRRARGKPAAGRHPSLPLISSRAPRRCKGFLRDRAQRPTAPSRREDERCVVNVLVRVIGYYGDTRASLARRPQGHPPSTWAAAWRPLFFAASLAEDRRVPRAAGWDGDMPVKLGSTAAAVMLCLAFASPAGAASHAEELKSRTDELLGKLELFSHGLLKWEGADRLDIREEGDAAIADIANARISIGSPEAKPGETRVRVEFDHIEVRHAPAPEGAVALSVALPPQSVLHTADGNEITLTLTKAAVKAVLDA